MLSCHPSFRGKCIYGKTNPLKLCLAVLAIELHGREIVLQKEEWLEL